MPDIFSSMKSLLASVEQQGNFAFEIYTSRKSSMKLFASHGGCIEPGTAPIVRGLASEKYDYFVFKGKSGSCKQLLHVTSTHYNEERCQSMSRSALLSFSVHGCKGKDKLIEVGGGNRKLVRKLLGTLRQNYGAVLGPGHRDGSSPQNFVNKSVNQGVQLELSEGFRNFLFLRYPKFLRQNPETFPKFIETIRTWLREIESGLSI